MRRGSARTWDHAQLVHAQWLHAAVLGMNIYIKRVDTNDNIADLPSRKVRWLFVREKSCAVSVPVPGISVVAGVAYARDTA